VKKAAEFSADTSFPRSRLRPILDSATGAHCDGEEPTMKYMLLKNYAKAAHCDTPLPQWTPAEIQAHIDFQLALGEELRRTGEFVDAQGLAWPDQARVVTSDGRSAPVVTDGPFPETKEFLAGYWIVDVDSPERAVQIAATASAAPGPNGAPIGEYIEVRAIMSAPASEQ
jgi:hypothetical protein